MPIGGLQLCGNSCLTNSVLPVKKNDIYFLERLYFSATNYFIFIAKLNFVSP